LINNEANHIDELRDIDLKLILEVNGALKDPTDKKKWHTWRGKISVSGQKFFNWNESMGGGGAIDLVIHLNKCDFKTAISWLKQHFPNPTGSVQPKYASRTILQLPKRDITKLDRVTSYLQMVRQIDFRFIKLLLEAGTLYADVRGNAIFLLLGKENRVVGAELRGTTSLRWRAMATGSRKDLGYFSIDYGKTKTLVLCESAIDALSYLTLNPNCLAISTSGANPSPVWLPSLINEGYQIFCGFDDDCTGNKMAEKMIQLYPTVKRLRPSKHDWNDLLISNRTR
jgi:hypothetical protein